MNNLLTVADYVINFFYKKGTTHSFLVPGGGAMYLNDAIVKHGSIKFIAMHNEQAVSIAAESYSRVNLHPGLAVVTSGPGSTNAITGVAGAYIESVPLIVLSGQVKRADLKKNNVRQNGPQEVDIISIVTPITKFAHRVMDPYSIGKILDKAYFEMMNGRKGPVWLDIPLDIQGYKINQRKIKHKSYFNFKPLKELNIWNELISAIKKSERPLVLAGHGVRLSGAQSGFVKLIKKLNIPFVSTWNSMDLIEYDNTLNIGRPGVVALRAPNFAIQNCDLLITIGARLDNVVNGFNLDNFASHAKKYVVDIDPEELKKFNNNFKKICIDAAIFIDELMKRSQRQNCREWILKCNQWKLNYSLKNEIKKVSLKKISHLFFIEKLSEHLPDNSLIVTGSSGLAIESFYLGFKNKKNQRIFLTSGLGSMGYGIPSLIGAAVNAKFKNIICIESDGSLMMNLQEMASLNQIKRSLKIIILNNKGYASIRNTQRNYFDSRYIATDKKNQLFIPNLNKISNAFEIDSISINNVADIDRGLKKLISSKSTMLCNVNLIENESLFPKCSAIRLKNGNMASMPLEDMFPYLDRDELKQQMYYPLNKLSKQIKDDK